MGLLERRWLWWLLTTATRQWLCALGLSLETTLVLPRGLRPAQRSKDFLYLHFPLILSFQGRVSMWLEKQLWLNKKKYQGLFRLIDRICWRLLQELVHWVECTGFCVDTDVCPNYCKMKKKRTSRSVWIAPPNHQYDNVDRRAKKMLDFINEGDGCRAYYFHHLS